MNAIKNIVSNDNTVYNNYVAINYFIIPQLSQINYKVNFPYFFICISYQTDVLGSALSLSDLFQHHMNIIH